MKIFFRVDSGSHIGTGHMVRCVTLAKELKKHDVKCIFLCRDHEGSSLDYIIKNGFELRILPKTFKSKNNKSNKNKWLNVSQSIDATQSIKAINKDLPDYLIVDHYGIDYRWHKKLRPFCNQLFVIDDIFNRKYDCDIILNQNLISNLSKRYSNLCEDKTLKLFGPKYALLQEEYLFLKQKNTKTKSSKFNILVYFGGTDKYNLTEKTLDIFIKLNYKGKIIFVLNSKNPNLNKIKIKIEQNKNFSCIVDSPSLARILNESDIAIGAGGTTMLERCALGVPTYVITVANNQKLISQEMDKKGYIKLIGNYEDISLKKLEHSLTQITRNKLDTKKWSLKCINLVDGEGTRRVVDLLLFNLKLDLHLRKARDSDERILFDWRNDKVVRRNSINRKKITIKEHSHWFESIMKNPNQHRIYILTTLLGFPIAQVRFSEFRLGWEIDYSIRLEFRGRNLANKILVKAIEKFLKDVNVENIYAQTLEHNIISQKVLSGLGFKEIDHKNNRILFELKSIYLNKSN